MIQTVIIREPEEGVRLVTISRPARRNALDNLTYAALSAALESAEADASVRVVVITGADGVFTSGNDLADFQAASESDDFIAIDFLKALAGFSKPVIAAVEGFAIGIGTTLLLHCDLAFAGRTTKFRLPFVTLGLCAEGASSYLLPRLAGTKRAAELLLLGDMFTAMAAAEAGIINDVTDDGGALSYALSKARAIAALPPLAVTTTKSLLKSHLTAVVAATIDVEAEHFRVLRSSPAAQAAFKAFLTK